MKQVDPLKFFSRLKWIDGRPLPDVIEPYRREIFAQALSAFDGDRPRYNLTLTGRAKKTGRALTSFSPLSIACSCGSRRAGNQCYGLANDLDQANDNLELAKKIVAVNPPIRDFVAVKQNLIERRDGKGFFEILPAGDVVGTHGKTYFFVGFDEIHGYKNWDLIESIQPDPTRPDAFQWITSYASIYHRPGVSLFDLMAADKKGQDPRMFFSWVYRRVLHRP